MVEKAPESMQELDEVSDFETKNHIPLYYESVAIKSLT